MKHEIIVEMEIFANVCDWTKYCKFNKGNIKLGAGIWNFSKLAGDHKIDVRGIGQLTGTCGRYCECCDHLKGCYVFKSYRYPSVRINHARNTLAFRQDLHKSFQKLEQQIRRAKNKPLIIRIDQSGEIESNEEFLCWCHLAELFPNILFWMYTKAFDFVIYDLLAGNVPMNLFVLISIWHEYGIEEYKRVCHLDNVKAFVYIDRDPETGRFYDYKTKHGLVITTYCKAYDEHGKMNHAITCEKCRKCFDYKARHKVIGCFDH